jgi:heat shock protein HslJ
MGCAAADETELDALVVVERTAAGCAPERHQQDDRLLSFFVEDPHWVLDGATLTMTAGDTVIVLAEQPAG